MDGPRGEGLGGRGHSGHRVPAWQVGTRQSPEWTVGTWVSGSMHSSWTTKQSPSGPKLLILLSVHVSAGITGVYHPTGVCSTGNGSQDLVLIRQVQGQPGLETMSQKHFFFKFR